MYTFETYLFTFQKSDYKIYYIIIPAVIKNWWTITFIKSKTSFNITFIKIRQEIENVIETVFQV